MKKLKVISAAILSLIIPFSAVGCKKEATPNTVDVIELSYWSSGLGEDYIKETIKGFEAKYPEYKVYFEPSANGGAIANTFGYGANYDTVDLYMYAINSLREEDIIEYAEPLDDIVNSKYENESMTLEEKILPKFRDALKSSDGKYHSLTYGGGWTGIAYNKNMFEEYDLDIPNTTDELVDLAVQIDDEVKGVDGKPVPPFIHYQAGGYWMTVVSAWQIQYDGPDYYFDTFLPLGGEMTNPDKSILTTEDGRKAAMDVMEQIITPGFVFNGSNALVFTDAQTYFLNDRAAMMVNGSWMINEMKVHLNEKQDFSMMPTPVISSIIEKVPDRSISNDKELSALITAIDKANTVDEVALSGTGYEVTKADLERVYEARHVMHSNFNEHGMLIPKYATAKEGAKKFIQYFYSDENVRMYHDVTHMTIPIQYSDGTAVNTTGWRDWEIQQQKFTDKYMTFFDQNANTSKIFTAGGCQFYGGIDFISAFCNPDSGQRLSSDKAWSQMVAIWDANWNNYKSNAQL